MDVIVPVFVKVNCRNIILKSTIMKNSITLVIVCCSLFILTTASAQEDEKKVKSTTTTTTTVTQETEINDNNQAKPAEEPQDNEASSEWKGFHIGGVAQATFTDVKIDGANGKVNTSYVVGYGGGAFIGYFFTRNVEVRAEALYSSLAQELKDDNDVKRKLELSYVNFPLLLALHTGYDKPVSFNITFGPQIGINTGSKLDGSGSEGIDTVQASINVKPADLGIAYGAGLDFGFGPEKLVHLNVGFRGVYGLVDISDESNNTTTNSYYIIDRAHLKTYSGYA